MNRATANLLRGQYFGSGLIRLLPKEFVKMAGQNPRTDLDTVFRALRTRARREILTLVWDRERPAGEIAAAFSLSPATISEHLRVLREAGLLEMTRVGTSRRYRARPEALMGVHG